MSLFKLLITICGCFSGKTYRDADGDAVGAADGDAVGYADSDADGDADGDGICRTEKCIETSRILSENMISTNPAHRHMACDDFYNYACGRYPEKHPLQDGIDAEMMMKYHVKQIDDKIADLLNRKSNENDPPQLISIRTWYGNCIQELTNSELTAETARKVCLTKTKSERPNALVYLLVKELQGGKARDRATEMLKNIISTFKTKIENSWLHEYGKSQAIPKIETVRSTVFYMDGMIKPTSEVSQAVRFTISHEFCRYRPDYHMIDIPITMMAVPFFNYGLMSMEYGGLGFAMARELARMFDKETSEKSQLYGIATWWNISRAKSFVDQYNQFTFEGPNGNVHVNGEKSRNENIADTVGFQLALNAYTKTHPGNEKKLIGFEEFTPEQLLTLAFATVHCENVSKKYNQERNDKTSFAPGPARVNGAVMNSSEFSKIWGCSETSRMNPPVKNDVWPKADPTVPAT